MEIIDYFKFNKIMIIVHPIHIIVLPTIGLSTVIVKTSIDHMFIYVGYSLVYGLIGCLRCLLSVDFKYGGRGMLFIVFNY